MQVLIFTGTEGIWRRHRANTWRKEAELADGPEFGNVGFVKDV